MMEMTMAQKREFIWQVSEVTKAGILRWEDALMILEIVNRRLMSLEQEKSESD